MKILEKVKLFIFFKACPKGKWGNNCLDDCLCYVDNTKTCNATTGVCSCFDGWEGKSIHEIKPIREKKIVVISFLIDIFSVIN